MKLIAYFVLMLIPTIAFSEDKNICSKVGDFAYNVMVGRQDGVPLSFAMENIQVEIDKAGVDGVNKDSLVKIVLDAYEEIDLSAFEEMAERAAIEHNNKWSLACYSGS